MHRRDSVLDCGGPSAFAARRRLAQSKTWRHIQRFMESLAPPNGTIKLSVPQLRGRRWVREGFPRRWLPDETLGAT